MRGAGLIRGVVVSVLVLLAACGGNVVEITDPPEPQRSDRIETTEEDDGHEVPRLNAEQLERYYLAQVAWVECMGEAGVSLSEPPTLEDFRAGDGAWHAGAELTDDQWNRMLDDESSSSPFNRCGEPPFTTDFAVSRGALERLYAWHVQLLACLETEGFPVDSKAPPLEEFVRTGGSNWVPARDFHARYGFLEGAAWRRVAHRCGNHNQDMWMQPHNFEVDRTALKAQYRGNLRLTQCLREAGFLVPEPPSFEEFVSELGWNWSNASIWEAVYRDNDRHAVGDFADGIDQACPHA